jgi:hypothetical protein
LATREIQARVDSIRDILGDTALERQIRAAEQRRSGRLRTAQSALARGDSAGKLSTAARADSMIVEGLFGRSRYAPRLAFLHELARDLGSESRMWLTCRPCDVRHDLLWASLLDGPGTSRTVLRDAVRQDSVIAAQRMELAKRDLTQADVIYRGLAALTALCAAAAVIIGGAYFGYRFRDEQRVMLATGETAIPKRAFARDALTGFFVWMYFTPGVLFCVSLLIGVGLPLLIFTHPFPSVIIPAWALIFAYALLSFYSRGLIASELQRDEGELQFHLSAAVVQLESLVLRRAEANIGPREYEAELLRLAECLLYVAAAYARLIFTPRSDNILRATLAIPLLDNNTLSRHGQPAVLQVWAYDRHHSSAHFTRFPMLPPGGEKPGAPSAFRSHNPQVIPDLRSPEDLDREGAHSCRSVMSFPVVARNSVKHCVGVLNIDSTLPNFFDGRSVGLIATRINPVLNLLAFALVFAPEDTVYVARH